MDTDTGQTAQTAGFASGTAPAGAGATPVAGPAPERFAALLADFRARFETRLAAWLAARRRAVEAELPEALPLVDAAADLATAGGKRLRPALVHFTHLACGGGAGEAALAIGTAVELFHAYLLVHDDVMDHAAVRRGLPAAHERFAALHRERGWGGDAGDFGRSAAILVGDLAHTWAAEIFAAAGTDAAAGRRRELERIFAALGAEVIGGQLLELRLAAQGRADEEELLRVLRLKSGRYSFERPIELGAVLAGAPAATRAALARYGRALGEAFQLQDDVLGLYGDAGAVGKPVGGDLAGGKYTFLVHFALERLDGAAAASVRAALGRADLAPVEAEAAAAAIRDSGALDRVREMIDERLDQARAELAAAFDERPAADAADGRDFLAGLIDGLGSRRR
jgi:geranylgeranyl diphosphate synthase type I